MSETRLNDTALRIVVTPSQSSYFAGETLSVTISITNTRSLQAQVVPPRSTTTTTTATHTHKRSAHSVSSARLARPPTSPGLPKSPSNAVGPRPYPPKPSAPTRKSLIGITSLPDHQLRSERVSARRIVAKSLSVDIPSHELAKTLPDDMKTPPLRAMRRVGESPLPPRAPSPLARTSSTPVPPNHPHARKASIIDGPVSIPQSASASSFALTLDPIAESMSSPIPPTPPFPSPASTPAPFLSIHPTGNPRLASHALPGTHHPQALLGNGHPSSRKPLPRESAELVLYAYVHLTGSLFLLPQPSLARVPALAALQRHKRGPRGGGSMDIGVASPPHYRGHERRSSSIAGSLWGLISSPAATVLSPGHRARAPSYGSPQISPTTHSFAGAGAKTTNHGTGTEGVGLGLGGVSLGLGRVQEGWDPEQSLPVFEVPPAMLAVDLSLGPGEERSYTYTVKLPSNLPPTYRGRSLRFSYQLSVGACRATAGASAPGCQSRVMKVPIRIYNHVSVSQPPRWYDLLTGSAESGGRLEGKIEEAPRDIFKSLRTSTPLQKRGTSRGSISDLRAYALLLLGPDPVALPSSTALPSSMRMAAMDDQESELHGSSAGGGLTGCREAVEVLTRVPKKVSYDVNKDGVKVAVLTFMKSAWRLGETVLGVVELNDREGRARILKLSAMLEAHESLPSDLTSPPTTTDKRHTSTSTSTSTRRVHAEHHASFIPQTLRTTFALDIPSDATPSFKLSLGGNPSEGGLAWKVRLCLLVAVAAPDAKVRGMVREGPRGHWGSTWVPTDSLAPLERLSHKHTYAATTESPLSPLPTSPTQTRSWVSLFASTFLGISEGGGTHDSDEVLTDEDDAEEVDIVGGEEEWREIAVETVECEVPVMVWPGNTAFRPEDVIFDV